MPPAPSFVTTTAATPLPLLATETVLFQIRRSVLFLIVPVAIVSALGLALAFIAGRLGVPNQLFLALRIGIIIAILFIDLIIVLDWLTTVYLLTNRRVQFRFGIVGQQTKTIALEQITDAKVVIGIFGRLFNYGDVVIDAANINSQIVFHAITSPATRLEQINDAKLQLGP